MQARDPKHDQNLIPKTPDPSERPRPRWRLRRNPTTPTPVQYPSRITSWGLTCIRAIAAVANVANPLRRPPGAILSPVRPRSLAGALNAEAEGDDGGGPEGVGAPAPHRLAWGGVDFWNDPPGRTYITAGEGEQRNKEQEQPTSSRWRHLTPEGGDSRRKGIFWPVLSHFLRLVPIYSPRYSLKQASGPGVIQRLAIGWHPC